MYDCYFFDRGLEKDCVLRLRGFMNPEDCLRALPVSTLGAFSSTLPVDGEEMPVDLFEEELEKPELLLVLLLVDGEERFSKVEWLLTLGAILLVEDLDSKADLSFP